ncbi:MAG: endolytic transglycosylase MltG [Acidobacteriota bacterium]|nr:endolytic transglycosylase MltG [Acidobacteriota bacterium]MDQ7088312.1 endolytic transglycosylase MltG [Acidobacteriota bacterium]
MKVRLLPVAAVVVALAVVAAAGTALFLHLPQGEPGAAPVGITVEPGASAAEVARALEERGVVRPAWALSRAMRLLGVQHRIHAGEYRFEPPLAPSEVIRILGEGRIVPLRVTVPEGLDLHQTAALLAQAGVAGAGGLLAAFSSPAAIADLDPRATDLEGYLFPETYSFPRNYDPRKVAAELVGTFRKRFVEVYADEIAGASLDLRELVTLASLVERETARRDERSRIAGVFVERLARHMRLQCDPTVIYALRRAGRWDGDIRRRDLAWDHPYNTYTRAGLPPGPIASPGLESLQAALRPERRGELFFVAGGDGGHVFSRNLADHQRAVRRYLRWRRGSGGGSR